MSTRFKYISETALKRLEDRATGAECGYCGERQELVLSVWHCKNFVYTCLDCISHARMDVPFRPPAAYQDPAIPSDQMFELVFCTPPIPDIEHCHDERIWPRHCEDFCQYVGEVPLEQISIATLSKFADEMGVDTENVKAAFAYGSTWAHEFSCVHCGKGSVVIDYNVG